MLWYKSWLETRSRFVVGLILLIISAAGTVIMYPQVAQLLMQIPAMDQAGPFGEQIRKSALLSQTFRGYVWTQAFLGNLPKTWALFAVMLGAGGLLSQASRGGGALFALSLPVSRARLMGVRAGTALAELFVLALVPSLLIPLFAPGIGESYSLVDALVHGVCLFVAGTVLFSLTFLLSTVFNDIWRPPLIVVCVSACLSFAEQVVDGLSRYSLFGVMSAESYFRDGALPWVGLAVAASASAAMLYVATVNMTRHDF